MTRTTVPPTASVTPDHRRALERFDLQALVHDLTRRHMAIEALSETGGATGTDRRLIRMQAEAQIIDWTISAVLTSVELAIAARTSRTKEPLRLGFRRLIQRHSAAIWECYERHHGKKPSARKLLEGPSLLDFDRFLRDEFDLPLPEKGLDSQLNPTCDDIDAGTRRRGGNLSIDHLLSILTALGEPADLERLRLLQIDPTLDGLLHTVTTAANATLEPSVGHVGLFPVNYSGRYAMESYARLLQTAAFTDRHIAIRLCEAERLYLVDRLNATQPVHPIQCASLHRLVDDLRGSWPLQQAMPQLSPDLFNRWCLAWRQTDRQRDAALPTTTGPRDDGYDLDTYLPTLGLPVPPIGSTVRLQHWVEQRLQRVLSVGEATQLTTALFAEQGRHGIDIHLSHDDAAVVSETLIERTLQPPVPLPEMAMVTCLLGKVGLPWLPPAGPPLPVHVRGVSASLVLGAAGLLPPAPAGAIRH